MTAFQSPTYIEGLVREFCKLPRETEWVEFKVNAAKPQSIGESVSALSNSAALNDKAFAYLIWGVENDTHARIFLLPDPVRWWKSSMIASRLLTRENR